MSNRYKSPKKKKKITYSLCIVLAVVAAVGAVCLFVHLCQKELPVYFSSDGSFLSSKNESEDEDYDIVEIIEPEPEEIIIVTDDPSKKPTLEEIIKAVESVEPTKENTVVVKVNTVDASGLSKRNVKLDVKCVLQNPELPTGCEITSLATVLNYYGYDVSKTTLSDDFLEKSEDQIANFWKVFLGNPRSSSSFGCYAQPITDAANKYLNTQDKKYTAVNYSGAKFEKLLKEVENGNPVIIWSTMYGEKENDLREPFVTKKWEIDGKTIQWIAPEHCMVLIGYDIDRNIAIMSDPQRGIVEYNLETVKSRYVAMHSQCVILEKRNFPPEITGIKEGETYYTTQYVTVSDDGLKDVTVNNERSDDKFFINGNAEKTYEIVATDNSGNKTTVKIYTKPISDIALPLTDLSEFNIKPDDREKINSVRNTALNIDTKYATDKEKSELNLIITSCDALLDKIESVSNEYKRIVTAVNDYKDETPTEEDIDILDTLIADIDVLTGGDNLTEEQRTNLYDLKDFCNNLLLQLSNDE